MPNKTYNFFKTELENFGSVYLFNTALSKIYTVYFNPDEYIEYVKRFPILLQEGYAFGFYNESFAEVKKHNDPAIFPTIYKIVTDFLKGGEIPPVLLYHCDGKDGKQEHRHKLFHNWFDKLPADHSLVNYSIEVQRQDVAGNTIQSYIGIITLAKHPNLQRIKDELEEFAIDLGNENWEK